VSTGNISYRRGPLPVQSRANQYVVPDAEQALSRFELDAWMQPDMGNVLATAPNLHVFSRVNAYNMRAKGAEIAIGTGLTGSREVVTFGGGAPADHEPMVIEGLRLNSDSLEGHYMVAGVFSIDAGASIGDAMTFFSAGTQGTSDNMRVFQQSGALRVRHGVNDHASVSEFSVGDTFLLMVCYDATADDFKAYINSLTPVTWESTAATGAVGANADMRIGSEWLGSHTGVQQLLDGFCRCAFVKREPWGRAEYDETRNAFLNEVAAIYSSDITLS